MSKSKFSKDNSDISIREDAEGTVISFGKSVAVTCRVCGRISRNVAAEQLDSYLCDDIYSKHFIVHNDCLYLIPTFHKVCREMFELSPLIYE